MVENFVDQIESRTQSKQLAIPQSCLLHDNDFTFTAVWLCMIEIEPSQLKRITIIIPYNARYCDPDCTYQYT